MDFALSSLTAAFLYLKKMTLNLNAKWDHAAKPPSDLVVGVSAGLLQPTKTELGACCYSRLVVFLGHTPFPIFR